MTATLLLRSARVVDLGAAGGPGEQGGPVDVRIAGDRIAEVGPGLVPARGEPVVDLEGRWVLPGMWDAHTHMDQWALARRRLDVSTARSAREMAEMVVAHLRAAPAPEGTMLVAAGFRDSLWPDAPTAALLDAAMAGAGLPPTPVVAVAADLHCAWLSTPALQRLGAADHPTGLLRETEWMPRMGSVDDVPPATLDRWVLDAAEAAAARGVVGVVDLEIADNHAVWRRRAAAPMPLRVVAGMWPEHLDAAVAAGMSTGDVVPGTGGMVSTGPLKVIVDGSLNTRTAWCHDPYPGTADHGVLAVGPESLVPLMARAHRHGLHCAIHAIGDRANALVLDAFAATGARGSIEHAQLLTEDDMARMAALRIVASVQPEHAMDDRDVADRYWAGRTGRAFAYGSLVRAGVRLALGSDAPVASLDPWRAVAAAVERSRDGREPWHPEQRVEARVALAASVRSRVAADEPADLVVVEADPLTARGSDLQAMAVGATMAAGRWTWVSPGLGHGLAAADEHRTGAT